ncbi:MAG: hypothetical protein ACE5R6_19590 [Candidatus Heimdallarchaeota archaeon]
MGELIRRVQRDRARVMRNPDGTHDYIVEAGGKRVFLNKIPEIFLRDLLDLLDDLGFDVTLKG